jgi:hypothetical protein
MMYVSKLYSGNPFVLRALELLEQHRGEDIDSCELSALLAEREPMLSSLNLDCAIQEAIQRSRDGWISEGEAMRQAEEARKAAEAKEIVQAEEAPRAGVELNVVEDDIDAATGEAA